MRRALRVSPCAWLALPRRLVVPPARRFEVGPPPPAATGPDWPSLPTTSAAGRGGAGELPVLWRARSVHLPLPVEAEHGTVWPPKPGSRIARHATASTAAVRGAGARRPRSRRRADGPAAQHTGRWSWPAGHSVRDPAQSRRQLPEQTIIRIPTPTPSTHRRRVAYTACPATAARRTTSALTRAPHPHPPSPTFDVLIEHFPPEFTLDSSCLVADLLSTAVPPRASLTLLLGWPNRFTWRVEEGGSSTSRWTPLPRKPRREAEHGPQAGQRPVRS